MSITGEHLAHREPDEDTDPGVLAEEDHAIRNGDDPAHVAFWGRLRALERESREHKRFRDEMARDGKDMLIAFGELKAQLANLKGQLAGYLLAGMLLASVVGVLAAKVVH